jgi:hypothetical protein
MRRATDTARMSSITYIHPVDANAAALSRTLGLAILLGAAIGVVARVAEVSQLAFGPYALSGNGALAVPAILAPVALYIGWIRPLRRRGAPWTLAMVLHLLGLEIGIALGQTVAGASTSQGLAIGAAFLVPVAVIAAITIVVLRRWHVDVEIRLITIAFMASLLLGGIPAIAAFGGAGMSGIAVGASAVHASRSRPRVRVALGVALFLLMVVTVFGTPIALSVR